MPLIGLGFVAAICLAVVVHKQWSQREHLRYPIAEVAGEFIAGGLFWMVVGLIYYIATGDQPKKFMIFPS